MGRRFHESRQPSTADYQLATRPPELWRAAAFNAKLQACPISEFLNCAGVEKLIPDLFDERGDDRLWILAEYSRRKSTGPLGQTIHGVTQDGKRFPISLTVSVYDHEGETRVSCIVRDITDRVQGDELQAEKLKQQNLELETLVRELNEFNYVASHDLQEPLRTMSTYCGLLRADLGGDLPPRADDDIQAILDASLRMQRLIADLLQYSRSGHQVIQCTDVDLNALLSRVEGDLQARLNDSGGRIEAGDLPNLPVDGIQFGRVFQNLIANGLKFRRSDVTPVVSVQGERNGGFATITIQDNGIGIEKEYQDQIFQPFNRLHGVGKYEGSGIGLSVCRKIVGRHGGTIEVASVPGEGSRFILTMPTNRNEAKEA